MLIISLDEYGQFEGSLWKRGIVGGTVFACPGEWEKDCEQRRIVAYLQKVCQECAADFPEDLHPRFVPGSLVPANVDALSRVQQRIGETFRDFLADAEPNGRYYLYLVVSEPEGVSRFESQSVGNLLRDSFAGNRYLHMSQMAIRNLVINNPKLQDQSYALHLATRILSEYATTDDQKEQARRLGMLPVRDPGGGYTRSYHLTNANSYISTLSAAMTENEREDVDFDLMVESIRYYKHDVLNREQSFMLLADIVCNLVQLELKSQEDQVPQRLLNRLDTFTTHRENMVWCYHDVDFILRKAINCMIEGNWFACLQSLYAIQSGQGDQTAFYREHWTEPVLAQLRSRVEPQTVTEAARRLSEYLRKPNASAKEGHYIAEKLLELTRDWEEDRYSLCRYLLSSCLLTLHNRAGNDAQAEECYRRCEQYAVSAPLVEFLELRNAFSVTLLNRQQYDKALANTRKTVELEALADKMKQDTFGGEGISIHHGRSLSQLGQCYGYLEQFDRAEECFQKALEAFHDSPVDRQITLSYLLHSYIDSGNKRAYAALAADYFGSADSKEQLQGIYQMENTTFPYALLVYLKAWYRLTPNGFYPRIAGPLLEDILEKGQDQTGHPWELIWKYVALLGQLSKKPAVAEEAVARLTACREESRGLLLTICEEGLASCKAQKETGKLTYMYR